MEFGEGRFPAIQRIRRQRRAKEHPLAVPCRELHLAVRRKLGSPGLLRLLSKRSVMEYGSTPAYQSGHNQRCCEILTHFFALLGSHARPISAVTITLSLRLKNRITLHVYPVGRLSWDVTLNAVFFVVGRHLLIGCIGFEERPSPSIAPQRVIC